MSRDLIARLGALQQPPPERFWAVVVSIQTGPPRSLTVQINGSTSQITGVRFSNSYTPTAGDVVYGWREAMTTDGRSGRDLIVENKLAT